jgi:rhamnulokinase
VSPPTAEGRPPELHAAVDLGASSGRVFGGRLEDEAGGPRLAMREVARFPNTPVRLPDGLHWDLTGLFKGMLGGLATLSREVGEGGLWVGLDAWGVDYGLLDEAGRLLGLPFHYRDSRTEGKLAEAEGLLGRGRLYGATGVQAMEINTVFQLMAEKGQPGYEGASDLLLVPDLFTYFLTGERAFEATNASTTQAVDVRSGEVAKDVLGALGLRTDIFPPSVRPGTFAGPVLAGLARDVAFGGPVSVVHVASHDTASAVLGVPALSEDFAYLVAGTWSLVGLELEQPVINEASREANFSNEVGVDGTYRFLRNVMGQWMLQECERTWAREGDPIKVEELTSLAASLPPFRWLVDVREPAFAKPGDMPLRVAKAARELGGPVPASPAETVRCIVDSVALAIAATLEDAKRLAGRDVSVLHAVGGGSANQLLLEVVAAATGTEVVAGPREASAVGNLLVQLRAAGRLAGEDRSAMRAVTARSFPLRRYLPDVALASLASNARSRLGWA